MGARILRLVHPNQPHPLDHLHQVIRFHAHPDARVYVEIKDVDRDHYDQVPVSETRFDSGYFAFKRLVLSEHPEIFVDLFPEQPRSR